MSDDVTITVRVNNQTAPGIRDVNGQLRSLDGRFAASAGSTQRSSNVMTKALVDVRGALLSLAPAAVPVAASLAPVVTQTGAAALGLAAFGAAIVPQIGNLKTVSDAQTKYSDAVAKYGARSKQAVEAQSALADTMADMPAATQAAAAGYQVLKDKFGAFSDRTARFTMAPVEKSFAVLGGILPRLEPMVEGTGTQLDRLVTLVGGEVASPGFDALMKKVSDYSTGTIQGAIDKTVHFARVLSEGKADGPVAAFMDYAREQGPAVRELITNLADAVANLLEGASEAGPGLLTLVNAMAKLAASVPPELIGDLMSVYAAFKLIRLAGGGIGAAVGGVTALTARVAVLRAASVAAGGGVGGLRTAIGSLSTGGKATVALGVVGALVAVMHELSDNKGPVAVDALSTSLNTLASTGKVTGVLKTNLDDIAMSIAMVSKGASDNKIAQLTSDFGTFIGVSTGPGISTARKNVDAWDKSMANLVRSGHSKEAADQYEILKKAWIAGGGDIKRLGKFTDDYKGALADQAFEQTMAAQSMGLFGSAAQDAQTKLDAQKRSADGLRQSIQALNDVNRQGLGGMIGFEAAIDAAATAAKKNSGALTMTNGVLNLGSEKARNAASALQDLADKTDGAAASARESGSSWETVNGIYARGRAALIRNAQAMGLTKSQAAALADQILKIPDKTAVFKMNTEDAKRDITSFNAALKATPGAKSVTLKALSKSGEQVLESFGLKVKRLPNGKVTVSTKNGQALSAIANVAAALKRLNGKTATTWTYHNVRTNYSTSNSVSGGKSVHDMVGATGGLFTGKGGGFRYAGGGPVRGPGTGTSDDVPAPWLSNGEFVIKAASVQKYGEKFLQLINDGQFDGPRYAKGGKVTKAQKAARAQAAAESKARREAQGDLTISHFGQMAGYQRSEFRSALAKPADLGSLVNSLNQWRGIIKAGTHGSQETSLLKALDSSGKKLLGWEKQLTKVGASLDKAKDKLNGLKDASAQLASSVKGGVLSAANITKPVNDGPVTTRSVMAGLTQSRDKATAFDKALADLKKKGLSSALLQQIGEANVDGGGLETAGALLTASSSEIKSMNSLQSQISAAAGSAGKTTADSVYAAQIKAQTATVKMMTSSQDRLKKSMDKLAASMEKTIERAFGKKAAGGIVGAAAAGGMRGGLTWVGEHEPELLDLPVGSRVWSGPDSRRKARAPWESMLTAPRGGSMAGKRAAALGGGAPVQPVLVQQTITLDGRVIARQIFDPLRGEIAHRGGNVQRALGQGGN
ncbi:phage tail protein [Streptomyces griseoviridis]|uniref:phage tail protein n=1 Tax=Streptomyces griseoviridis TaxID=45398 RepID=UPI0033F974E9